MFANIKKVGKRQKTKQIESHGIDGICRFGEIPGGWEGTIDMDRANSNADDFFAALEAAYYAGTDVGTGTITELITENGNAQTSYRMDGCVFKFENAGDFTGDGLVPQVIGFTASKRIKVF